MLTTKNRKISPSCKALKNAALSCTLISAGFAFVVTNIKFPGSIPGLNVFKSG